MNRFLLVLLSLALPTLVQASGNKTVLHGSKPAWANSKNYAGAANAKAGIGFRVYLGWNNPSGAVALAQAVSNPRSSSYRHYLTPAQFRQKFAPTATQVAQVQSWLTSQGFNLVYTPANNHYVSAQGTIAQAQAAFGTNLGMYKAQGLTLRSPSADVSIPSSLAGVVSAVIGLDQSYEFIQTNHVVDGNAPPEAGFRNSPPLSAFWAELVSPYAYPAGYTDLAAPPTAPWAIKGHTPDQIKGAYGISSSYDGTGQTVAIIDAYASPTILQDANQWSTNRGIPQFGAAGGGTFTQVVAPGTYNVKDNPRQGPTGWYGEETLDVEAVHGMAPNANVVYVGAPNNYQDLDAAMNHVVDRHLAQIVTNSYGFPTTELLPFGWVKPLEDTLIQAAIEGIGVYFSSGDSGDNSSVVGFATASWPASSPWVTAVGGTALGVSAGKTRVIETGWGTSTYNCDTTTLVCTRTGWLYGAGGGVSVVFPEPSYQTNYGLSLTGRGIPDVAALADPQTGLLVGQTQTFPKTCNGPGGPSYDEYRVGGTSLASPIFAGLMALADQKAGAPHGFANFAFYQHPGAFYDVTSVKTAVARRNFIAPPNFPNGVDDCIGTVDRLRTFDDYSGSPTQFTDTGWDNVTGLGTPSGIFSP